MNIDSLHFREALASLASGVCVITAQLKGEAMGITVSSFTSLSLTPPLVLFCLNRTSKSKTAFALHQPFIVHLLGAEQQHLAQHFAASGKTSWESIAYQETREGVRALKHCITAISCTVHKQHAGGDHVIIIGKVHAIRIVDKSAKPLLYFRRHYHDLGAVTN